MKIGTILGAIVVVLLIIFGIYFVDIDQTEEASLPDVDVSVEGGNAPEFEANVGDVEVGETEITVPTLDVQSPEEEAAEEGTANN